MCQTYHKRVGQKCSCIEPKHKGNGFQWVHVSGACKPPKPLVIDRNARKLKLVRKMLCSTYNKHTLHSFCPPTFVDLDWGRHQYRAGH